MLSTLLGLVVIVLNILAISDVLKSDRDMTTKVVVVVLILLMPIVGAGVYLLVFRDKGY